MEKVSRKPGDGASDNEDVLFSVSKLDNRHSYDNEEDTGKPPTKFQSPSPPIESSDSLDIMEQTLPNTRIQDTSSLVNFDDFLGEGQIEAETAVGRSRSSSINTNTPDREVSIEREQPGRGSISSSINANILDKEDGVETGATVARSRSSSINTIISDRSGPIHAKTLVKEDVLENEALIDRSRSNSVNTNMPDEEFDSRKAPTKEKSQENRKEMRKYSNRSDDTCMDINENTKRRGRISKENMECNRIKTPEIIEIRKASPQEMWRRFKEEDEAITRKMGLMELSLPDINDTEQKTGTNLTNINARVSPFRTRNRNFKSPTEAKSRLTPISRNSPNKDGSDTLTNSRLSPNMEDTPREERKIIKRTSPNLRQNESPFYGIEDPFRPSSRSQLFSDLERSHLLSSASNNHGMTPGGYSPDPGNSKFVVSVRSIGKCMRVKRYVKKKVKVETPEDGYDTDLEIDTSEEYKSRQIEQRMAISRQNTDIGHHSYEEACVKFGSTPLRRVVSQLWSTKMNLQHLGLNINEMKALSVALMHNTRIEELDLDDNGLDGKCMTYVADLLKTNYFITKISLSNNQMGEKGAEVMYETLQSNNWLTHVNLSGTQLGDEGIAFIANGIEENMTVKWLDLSHNNIGVKGGLYIGRVLGVNYSLEHLDVSWNQIRLAGAVAVCKSIQKNKSLLTLNISWNGLGFEGSLAVGEALKSNKTLATLNLCNNRINWECIPYIGRGLRVNKSLKVLELGLNPISMEGCDELLESISKQTCGLTHLGLENIPINTEVAFKATEVSKHRNFSLHHGGILSTRDMIGIQRAKKEDPLSLLIRFLSTMGIRVVDLFRMFETESKLYVSKANFITGLKRLRAPLDDADIREVLKKIYINKTGNISYQSLAAAVRNQLREDRREDMKEEKRLKKRREERRRILRSDMPLIAPAQVFFPNIFTFYGPKVIQRPLEDIGSPSMFNSRQSSRGYTPSSVHLPKLSVSSRNDYDSWHHSPPTLIGSLVYDMQRMTPSRRLQTHSSCSTDDRPKQMVRKRSD